MIESLTNEKPCPCCSGEGYQQCCQPVIDSMNAKNPLQLMRSRYTAYIMKNIAYIEATMQGKALSTFHKKTQTTTTANDSTKWCRLEIVDAPTIDEQAITGSVEFIAYYREVGHVRSMHERSQFKKIDGKWFYVDGTFISSNRIGKATVSRNVLCPCQSGKKYKRCCGLHKQ